MSSLEPEIINNLFIFKHPFTALVAGPSQSGKSYLIRRILENRNQLIDKPINKIVYCYSVKQEAFNEINNVEFCEGLPDLTQFDPQNNNLIILDDLMADCEKAKNIQSLFTIHSHHKNISVFLITQNLFFKGPCARTISLNCRYIIIFNNPRCAEQVMCLSRQIFPFNSSFLVNAYNDAVESFQYGYILIDNTPTTPLKYRIQTCILPNETRIYYRFKVSGFVTI